MKREEREQLLSALDAINPASLSRLEWLKVGFALHYEGLSVSDWDSWSRRDPDRYKPGECASIWGDIRDDKSQNTKGSTIIAIAKESGWTPPRNDEIFDWKDEIGDPGDRPAPSDADSKSEDSPPMSDDGERESSEDASKEDSEEDELTEDEKEAIRKEAEERAYFEKRRGSAIIDAIEEYAESLNTAPAISTGFKKLDFAIHGGLRKALYIIGGVSNSGKSTLALQIADAAASQGNHVLYFANDQGAEELAAKSLARISYELSDRKTGLEAADIMTKKRANSIRRCYIDYSDAENELRQKAIDKYREKCGEYMHIISIGGKTVHDIEKIVEAFIEVYDSVPVVFVDYLQMITAPSDLKVSTEKAVIDYNIAHIRGISDKYNTPVVVISSLGRDDYYTQPGLDVYKGSGEIEYNADYAFLLGFAEARYKGSNNKETIKKIIERVKEGSIRAMELALMKSRLGRTDKLYLVYNASHDIFSDEAADMSEDERKKYSDMMNHVIKTFDFDDEIGEPGDKPAPAEKAEATPADNMSESWS